MPREDLVEAVLRALVSRKRMVDSVTQTPAVQAVAAMLGPVEAREARDRMVESEWGFRRELVATISDQDLEQLARLFASPLGGVVLDLVRVMDGGPAGRFAASKEAAVAKMREEMAALAQRVVDSVAQRHGDAPNAPAPKTPEVPARVLDAMLRSLSDLGPRPKDA